MIHRELSKIKVCLDCIHHDPDDSEIGYCTAPNRSAVDTWIAAASASRELIDAAKCPGFESVEGDRTND